MSRVRCSHTPLNMTKRWLPSALSACHTGRTSRWRRRRNEVDLFFFFFSAARLPVSLLCFRVSCCTLTVSQSTACNVFVNPRSAGKSSRSDGMRGSLPRERTLASLLEPSAVCKVPAFPTSPFPLLSFSHDTFTHTHTRNRTRKLRTEMDSVRDGLPSPFPRRLARHSRTVSD